MSARTVLDRIPIAADGDAAIPRLRAIVGEHRWLVGWFLVVAGLLGTGFVIDTVAGATPEQDATLHVVAGLLGAFAAIIGIVGVLGIVAFGGYRLYRTVRGGERADPG